MKKNSLVLVLLGLLVAAVVVEEVRINRLKTSLADAESQPAAQPERKGNSSGRQLSVIERHEREEKIANRSSTEEDDQDESPLGGFGKVMRKMADNPAAKAMFAQAHVASAQMLYGPLVEKFNLNGKEKDYFLKLVAGEFADQQQLGMKMMGTADAEERKALVEELEKKKEERKKLIAEFLNSEDDEASFEAYHDRLAEHQQMPGIRGALEGAGVPLKPEQETALVDAMYEVRTNSGDGNKWEGASGMDLMAKDNVVELFEADWEKSQAALQGKLSGVLEAEQLEAFSKAQEQMKEFQLMGIKMMQNMQKSGQ